MPHIRIQFPASGLFILFLFFALAGCKGSDVLSASQEKIGSSSSGSLGKECGDLMSQYGKKPKELEFIGCSNVHALQTSFVARYRVSGQKAFIVQDFLHSNYGMNNLIFACCGWEPKEGGRGSLKIPGHYFSISMYSEETLMNDPAKWSELPFFYVDFEEVINV